MSTFSKFQTSPENTHDLFTVPLSSNLNISTCKQSQTNILQHEGPSPSSSSISTNQLPKIQTQTMSKSVAVQMELGDLLDEIDVNLVLESAARRCSPESLLTQFKVVDIF